MKRNLKLIDEFLLLLKEKNARFDTAGRKSGVFRKAKTEDFLFAYFGFSFSDPLRCVSVVFYCNRCTLFVYFI